jgi:hypothetical protein
MKEGSSMMMIGRMEMQMFSFKLQPDEYYPMPQHLLGSLERYLNHGVVVSM